MKWYAVACTTSDRYYILDVFMRKVQAESVQHAQAQVEEGIKPAVGYYTEVSSVLEICDVD